MIMSGMAWVQPLILKLEINKTFSVSSYLLVKSYYTVLIYIYMSISYGFVGDTLCAAQSIHPSAHGLMLMSTKPSTMFG